MTIAAKIRYLSTNRCNEGYSEEDGDGGGGVKGVYTSV
jgi:hypothetical protein